MSLDLRRIYKYWGTKILDGEYGNLRIYYNLYEEKIDVYIKKNTNEFDYIGSLRANGRFSGDDVVSDVSKFDYNQTDKLIESCLNVMLCDYLDEFQNMLEILKLCPPHVSKDIRNYIKKRISQ